MAQPTHLDVNHVLQVIRFVLRISAQEMAARTGLPVASYRMLEQEPPVVPNEGWNRLLTGMAIVDAVFGGEPGSELGSVPWTILAKIHELEQLDPQSRRVELDRLRLELTWIDAGGL